MGTKTALKIESFAFFDNSRFMTTEQCKARITALALPIRVSNSSSCLPSLVNATPRYLNFSTCFSVAPFTCNTHWLGFLKRWSTSVLAVLIFIPAVWHASAKLFNVRWRPDSVEESRTKSSANGRRLILQFPIVAHSSAWLHLSIQFMQTMKRRGDKTHPCRSPTPTWNGFDCLPFIRTLKPPVCCRMT